MDIGKIVERTAHTTPIVPVTAVTAVTEVMAVMGYWRAPDGAAMLFKRLTFFANIPTGHFRRVPHLSRAGTWTMMYLFPRYKATCSKRNESNAVPLFWKARPHDAA